MPKFNLSCLVLMAALVLPQDHALADIQAESMVSAGMGAAMVGMAGSDLGRSLGCCAETTQSGCNAANVSTSGACFQAGMNTLAIAGGVLSIVSSFMSAGGARGSGASFGAGFSPNNASLAERLGCKTLAECGCTGPDAALNPVCSNDALNKLNENLDAARAVITSGAGVPEGTDINSALAELDAGQAKLNEALSALSAFESGELSPESFANAGKGQGYTGGAAEFDDFGGGGGFGGGSGIKAGPEDRAGLGRAVAINQLDLMDPDTGKNLTLWQRATRRYQGGQDGKRAFHMARVEFIRQQSKKRLAMASAQAKQKASRLAADMARKEKLKKVLTKHEARQEKLSNQPKSNGRSPAVVRP